MPNYRLRILKQRRRSRARRIIRCIVRFPIMWCMVLNRMARGKPWFFYRLAESAGYCWGVRRAMDGVVGLRKKTDPSIQVVIAGRLVNNPDATAQLEAYGITRLESADSEAVRDSVAVVTAHGLGPKKIEAMGQTALRVINMTCPIVDDLHKTALSLKAQGRELVLIGIPGHVEVVGTADALEGNVVVVHSTSDVASIPYTAEVRIGVVAQTTTLQKDVEEILAAIKERYADVVYAQTLCEDILWRQEELAELAREAEAAVIIGAPISANTTHLAKMAAELERSGVIQKHFFIPNASAFPREDLSRFRRILVTSGASAPASSIQGVLRKLEARGGIRHFASA